jgi:hypothetical protein
LEGTAMKKQTTTRTERTVPDLPVPNDTTVKGGATAAPTFFKNCCAGKHYDTVTIA